MHSEKHHNVFISEQALESAVNLSHRYIIGRQLPDKAVGLLDTACARVAMSQASKPNSIEKLENEQSEIKSQIAFYASTPSYHKVLHEHGWGDFGEKMNKRIESYGVDVVKRPKIKATRKLDLSGTYGQQIVKSESKLALRTHRKTFEKLADM